jgi:C4-dicarboxylate-binding protein DctP
MYTKARIRMPKLIPFVTLAHIAVGIFPLFTIAPAVHAADGPLTIRISTQHTPQMDAFQSIIYFKDRVEKASQGRIKVDVHHSASLYSDKQVVKAVSAGEIEMGFGDLSRYADVIPAADLFQLPFLFNTSELETRATAPGSEIRMLIDNAILTETNTRVLWWSSLGQTVFESQGEPVSSPDKIAGKKVRTVGPTSNTLVKQCGGQPVDISGPQMEKAFEAREVDVAMTAISTVHGRQLWRYFDTITRTNHSSVQFAGVINDKFWAGLSIGDRALLTQAALAADTEARRLAGEAEANAYNELASSKGMKIAGLSKEELQLWRICSSDVILQYLDRSGPLGLNLMHAYGRLQLEAPPAEAPVARAAPVTLSKR